MKILTLIILGIALMSLATAVAAHEFSVPATVTADGDGHFSYEVTVEITSAVEFASAEADGTDNTDIGHWIADGFCMNLMAPGVYTYNVSGSLIYLFLEGSVTYRHSMCDGWVGMGTTIILPPTVADTPVTWSGLKALYR